MPRKRRNQKAALEREQRARDCNQLSENPSPRTHSTRLNAQKRTRASSDTGSVYAPSETSDVDGYSSTEEDAEDDAHEEQLLEETDSEEENDEVWYGTGQKLYPVFNPAAWAARVKQSVSIPAKRKAKGSIPGQKRGPYTKKSRTTQWRLKKHAKGSGNIVDMFSKIRAAQTHDGSEGSDSGSETDEEDTLDHHEYILDAVEKDWNSIQMQHLEIALEDDLQSCDGSEIDLEPLQYDRTWLDAPTCDGMEVDSDHPPLGCHTANSTLPTTASCRSETTTLSVDEWIRSFPAAVVEDPPGVDDLLDYTAVYPGDLLGPIVDTDGEHVVLHVLPNERRPWLSAPGIPADPADIPCPPSPVAPPPSPITRTVPVQRRKLPPEPTTPFAALDKTLLKLLAAEKRRLVSAPKASERKRKSADTRALYDINVIRDWNRVREALHRTGNRRADSVAATRIAEVKAATCKNGKELTKGPWFARQLLRKARHVIAHGTLPPYKQGTGARSTSPLDRPEVRAAVEAFVVDQGVGKCTPLILQKHVNSVIAPKFHFKPISEKTAYNWMIKMGFSRRGHKKGAYHDGHERPDVVGNRVQYNGFFQTNDHLIRKYDDKTMDPLPLALEPGERELLVVFHDESSFHANDLQSSVWLREGEQLLRQKSRGRIVHVSDFIVEETGRLVLGEAERAAQEKLPPAERLEVYDARQIIHPGKNHDPYWNMEQLIAQVDRAIAIRKVLFPDKRLVWVFDNSSAHGAFAQDALLAHKMNVNPGGAQPKMHATFIPLDNPNPSLRGKRQTMVFEPGHANAGDAKGMEQILRERGLYDSLARSVTRNKPVGVCADCRLSEQKRDELARKAKAAMEADPDSFASLDDAMNLLDESNDAARPLAPTNPNPSSQQVWCCMRRCLSQQADFRDEKPLLQLRIEAAGDICLFLPKFHCELNPIELYWGWTKFRYRLEADGKFPTARRLVPEILDKCDIKTIRRFFRKTWRYQDAYRRGLTGKQLEHAVKKYKSHRKLPGSALMDLNVIS